MRNSKILGYILIVFNLGSFALFALTAHTIVGVLASATPRSSDAPIVVDAKTGVAQVSFEMEPRNNGFLEADITVGVRIVTSEESLGSGQVASFRLAPGESKKVVLTLKVPTETLQLYSEGQGSLELETGVKTLYNLAQMDYKVRLKGEGKQ